MIKSASNRIFSHCCHTKVYPAAASRTQHLPWHPFILPFPNRDTLTDEEDGTTLYDSDDVFDEYPEDVCPSQAAPAQQAAELAVASLFPPFLPTAEPLPQPQPQSPPGSAAPSLPQPMLPSSPAVSRGQAVTGGFGGGVQRSTCDRFQTKHRGQDCIAFDRR